MSCIFFIFINLMNLERLERELKKRWVIPYSWKGTKQTNELDKKTRFIYKTYSFKRLLERSVALTENEKNYAYNRWYNFWSAEAVEYIFSKHQKIKANEDKYHKSIDFWIKNIPFDHKTTVFPKGFNKSVPYAIEYKRELIEWLYANQSTQKRFHLKNRLFLIVLDYSNPKDNWKLKSEILWLQKIISTYLSTFDAQNLENFYFQNQLIKSDIIWAIK